MVWVDVLLVIGVRDEATKHAVCFNRHFFTGEHQEIVEGKTAALTRDFADALPRAGGFLRVRYVGEVDYAGFE